jgi:hypothetical protein
MFLIMGLPWLLESFHHLLHSNHPGGIGPCSNDFGEIIFRISSGFNVLRGFFLFIIFVCKPSIWKKLQRRFGLASASVRPSRMGPTQTTRLTRSSMEMETFGAASAAEDARARPGQTSGRPRAASLRTQLLEGGARRETKSLS